MIPTPEALIRLACLWEATARKPGNVHPHASFSDLTYADFTASAAAASPWLAQAAELGVGVSIEQAQAATRQVVRSNSNLGILLLIAPLAAVPQDCELGAGIANVLTRTTVADAAAVYRAIRRAAPAGLGRVNQGDVLTEPTETLTALMGLAADRDRIARQYVTDFADVLEFGLTTLDQWLDRTSDHAERSIIGLYLSMLAEWPDSLVARKCGLDLAQQASQRAAAVLSEGWPERTGSEASLREFDDWLREDGNRRNPGTTADLVAATLYAHLRESIRAGRRTEILRQPTIDG